jgi:Leucine-rich repeat (LRR) protein
MRLKLILKKIISNVITRNLTKTEASELLISLLEKSETAKERVSCIDSLVGLNIKTEKICKILEYCLISDDNPEVREATIKGIVKFFSGMSIKALFKWVVQKETSLRVLKAVINSLVNVNNNLSKILENKVLLRYSKIYNIVPEETKFFWDLDLILSKKPENDVLGKNLKELFTTSKSFSGIPENFFTNTYKPFYSTRNRRVHILNLGGCGLVKIPGSINLLSNLNYLNLSYNKMKSIPNSISSLFKLRSLNLAHNRLRSIPNSINSLSKLKYINLSFNPINPIPISLLKLVKQKFTQRYIWTGVIPIETPVLGLLEILTGYQLSILDKHMVFDINQEFVNAYRINDEGHITGICIYDGELNNPLISIIPEQVYNLRYLDVMVIPIKRIEFIPNCTRNLTSLKYFENRYINR